MKRLFTISLLLISINCFSQRPDYSAECKQAMRQVASLAGDWQGQTAFRSGPGPEQIANQVEHIVFKLDSTILQIEGTGTKDGQKVFEALAILNYNPFTKAFEMKSFLKEGTSTEAYFKVLSDTTFEWGFDIPQGGKIRYNITLQENKTKWIEKGEYTGDGQNWYPFVSLDLTRK